MNSSSPLLLRPLAATTRTMTHARRPRLALLLAAVAAVPCLFAGSALAQNAVPTVRPQQDVGGRIEEPLADQPQSDPDANVGAAYSFTGGASITTHYFFRGFLQEDQGVIVQPFAELGISLFNSTAIDPDEPNSFSVDATAGIWNSVHSEKTGAVEPGPSNWYESDQYAGITVTSGNLNAGVLYTFYTYPNGALDTVGEIAGIVGFAIPLSGVEDDPGDVDVSLDLAAIAAYETFDNNGTEDAYLEVDVTPSLAFETGGTDLTLDFPFIVGASLKDYYPDADGSDEFFGYFSVAAVLGVPIPVPASYGSWTLSGGVQYLYLNADVLQAANNGDDSELVGSVALEIAF